MNHEDPPVVPPRSRSVVSFDWQAQHGIGKEYFEQSLNRLHESLILKITEYHSAVERALPQYGVHARPAADQASDNTEIVIKELWTLLDPLGSKGFVEFAADPVNEVRQRLSILEEERDTLKAEKKSLEDERNDARKLSVEAKASIGKLKEQNAKYRNIIIKSGGDSTEVPDDKIHSQFVELRELTQRIVHKYFSAHGQIKLSRHNNPYFEDQKLFRDDLAHSASESLQRFMMRAKIFAFINDRLLSGNSFGIGELEECLTDFENELISRKKTSHADLAEWRSRTIECGQGLDEKSRRPKDTCREILAFMDPQISTPTRGSVEQLERSMRELCEKAYDLSLLLRRSKGATFKILRFRDDDTVTAAVEAEINCQVVDGPRRPSIIGSRISMIIFGGLEKFSGSSGEERVILEKPHVVCYT